MRFVHLFLLLLFIVSITNCNKDKLVKTHIDFSFDTDYDLNQIHFFDDQNGIILGGNYWQKGMIFNTVDGGKTWQQDSFTNKAILSISLDNNNNIHATGPDGFVHKRDASTGLWSQIAIRPFEVLTDVSAYNNRAIVSNGVAYGRGQLFFVENNVVIDTSIRFDTDFQSVHMSSTEDIQVMGYGIVVYSPDFGASWDTIDISGDFYIDMSFVSDDTGFGLGQQGSILKTTNKGKNWEVLRKPKSFSSKIYNSIKFIDSQTGFVCGEDGLIEITFDGGQNWNSVLDLPKYNFKDIYFKDNALFAVGSKSKIIKIKDIL